MYYLFVSVIFRFQVNVYLDFKYNKAISKYNDTFYYIGFFVID